jgi:FkbH-like protein
MTCVNFFGTTETQRAVGHYIIPAASVPASHPWREEGREEGRVAGKEILPLGKGIGDVQLLVLNSRRQLAGVGERGEIFMRSPHLARGYLGDEALTGQRFSVNPFTRRQGDRLYRTGDLGRYLPDGNVEALGRADFQIKIRGFRVEPGEIEALLGKHAGVREAVVIAREDVPGDKRLAAYVVAEEGQAPTTRELRLHLKESLPEYMIPSAFVMLAALPLTPNGKVNRRALPVPPSAQTDSGEDSGAPRTLTEELLAGIWMSLLKLEQVGIHDNFFELGGHSLLATQLLSRVREAFKVELPLRRIFETPTVAGVAAGIEAQLRAGQALQSPPLVPVERDAELPLSFAQQRQWLLDQLEPGSAAYNMPAAIRLRGRFDRAVLERALREIVARHESLRTTFPSFDGMPVQVISPETALDLPLVDLGAVAEDAREIEARRLIVAEAQTAFDLSRGPLLRVKVLRLGDEDHVVLYTMHHIISDGWSMRVLMREMSVLYDAFSQGERSPLAALPVQYADYAVWQRRWLRDEVLAAQTGYWKQQLTGAPPLIDLPTDRPRPPVQSLQAAKQTLELPGELSTALRELSGRAGVTLFMTLLAAFQALLSRFTGQENIVVGTATANRIRPEIESLIGYFANNLALHTELSGNPTFHELLLRVREVALGAYTHQDLPFEKLLEELRPERDLSYSPVFQVMFILQPQQQIAGENQEQAGLAATHVGVGRMAANVDLHLSLSDDPSGISGVVQYRTDLFDADTISDLMRSFVHILESVVARPATTLSELDIASELQARVSASRAREQKQTLAITATFTAEPIEDALRFWMRQLDLPAHIEFAPYNQVFQQLLDPRSLLATNQQGVNLILLRFEDWLRFEEGTRPQAGLAQPSETLTPSVAHEKIERNVRELLRALHALAERMTTPHLICVCPASPTAARNTEHEGFFRRMEELMAVEMSGMRGCDLIRSQELSQAYPVADYYDAQTDAIGHIPFTQNFYAALGTVIARRIQALRSAPRKVIVLDCDETLWKGVCAEDGAQGVEIDGARQALQKAIVAQHDRGMLVCLCSKNEPEDVFQVFEQHPGMLLRREHLANWRINWKPKSQNLRALAEELQLGLDSFIFIDNDPVECAAVEAACPEVLTFELPRAAAEIERFIESIWAFDRLGTTAEDTQRTTLYRQNQERERFRHESPRLEDFLDGLELQVEIGEPTAAQHARVAQLTQRTNQFNATTLRRTEAEIAQLCQGQSGDCLVVEVRDRFGDYGLVGVIIFNDEAPDAISVETLLLSCRVLGRGVEHRLLAELGRRAQARGRARVDISYVPTKKNQPVLDFLEEAGGAYKERHAEGYVFKLPVEVAAGLSLSAALVHAGHETLPATKTETARLQKPATAVRGASALAQRIATQLNSAEQIQSAIEKERQRARSEAEEVYVAPRTPIEEVMAEIWAQLLGITRVGVHDNFFKLGGHSLLGTVLISRLRDKFNVELPLISLFESPTLSGLAETVELFLIKQTGTEDMAEMLKELEQLSEEELQALLESEGAAL